MRPKPVIRVALSLALVLCGQITGVNAAPAPVHKPRPPKKTWVDREMAIVWHHAAAQLLDMPKGAPVPPAFTPLIDAVRTEAIKRQILDERETRYVFAKPEDFKADLNMVRKRNADLADAPPIEDAVRFPDRSLIQDLIEFNRKYLQHLKAAEPLHVWDRQQWQAAIQETEQCYQVWDTVRDVKVEFYYVTVRRAAMKKLRDLIGFQAYYAGCPGPHVPIWRFRRLD